MPYAISLIALFLVAALTGCSPAPFGTGPSQQADALTTGHALMEQGEYERALKAYYRAAGNQGLNVDTLSAIGSANLALGRLGQAEQVLRRALTEDPGFVPALNNLGVVLTERGNYGEARILFQQAFAADSGVTDSIRQNLIRAIALTEANVYDSTQGSGEFVLVRREKGRYVLLTQL